MCKMGKMAFYKQPDAMDCAPIQIFHRDKLCLRMVAKHYGKNLPTGRQGISLQTLREKTQIGKESINFYGTNEWLKN